VARVSNLARLLDKMGEQGITRIGLDGRANDLYTTIPGEGPVALVLGGEEKGSARSSGMPAIGSSGSRFRVRWSP
jgi:23S rRNA (guanosine2251-2'-O)-methyltransferase